MTLDGKGYIDLSFVAPEHQRQGVGGQLYACLETAARRKKIKRLHSQASYIARGLFEKYEWEVTHEQQVDIAGVALTNFLMEKWLDDKE